MANPAAFATHPELAWGFYGHRLKRYRETVPHGGFAILRGWADHMRRGAFVFTSNVDGQFQKAGILEDRVHECHGSKTSKDFSQSRQMWKSPSCSDEADQDAATARRPAVLVKRVHEANGLRIPPFEFCASEWPNFDFCLLVTQHASCDLRFHKEHEDSASTLRLAAIFAMELRLARSSASDRSPFAEHSGDSADSLFGYPPGYTRSFPACSAPRSFSRDVPSGPPSFVP